MKTCVFRTLIFFLGIGVTLAQERTSLYQRSEKTIIWNHHNLSNPFTDVELKLYITAPAGRKLGSSFEFYGFFDGNGSGGQTGNVWKYRICLDQPGTWTVKARFVQPGTNNQKSGAPPEKTFTYTVSSIKSQGEHGHIYVDRTNNWRSYRHADGTPWVPLPFQASSLAQQEEKHYKAYIDEHIKRNIDILTFRFHDDGSRERGFQPRYQWMKKDGSKAYDWPGSRNEFDYNKFDLETWNHQDRMVDYAHSKGMKLAIWFGISGINGQYNSYGPMDQPSNQSLKNQQKLLIKYILARWAAYTNWWLWTVNSEWEEASDMKQLNISYAKGLREMNPWKIPITNHSLRDWTLGGYEEGWDIAQVQRRVDDTETAAVESYKLIEANDKNDIPVYNIEGVWNLSPQKTRIAMMSHLMAGGCGDVGYFENGGGGTTSSWLAKWDGIFTNHRISADEVGKMGKFFNNTKGIDISHCVPSNSLVSVSGVGKALCLADAGMQYYIWLSTGGKATVDLSAGSGQFQVYRYRGDNLDNGTKLSNVNAGSLVQLLCTPNGGFGNDYLYVLKGNASSKLQITTLSFPDANEGAQYTTYLDSKNGTGTVVWSVTGGLLPNGLSLLGRTINGNAIKTGISNFTLQAKDNSATVLKQFTIKVNKFDATAPQISNVQITDQRTSSITVTWTTDEPATSRVQWGNSASKLEGDSGEDAKLVTSHSVKLSDRFGSEKTYYLLIITSDVNNNNTQHSASFTTKALQTNFRR